LKVPIIRQRLTTAIEWDITPCNGYTTADVLNAIKANKAHAVADALPDVPPSGLSISELQKFPQVFVLRKPGEFLKVRKAADDVVIARVNRTTPLPPIWEHRQVFGKAD
jgi:hypothetical protein